MKKKSCILALMFCLLIILMPRMTSASTVESGTCGVDGDNVTWTLDSNGKLTISGTGEMKDYGYNDVERPMQPWTLHGGDVKSVVISEGVTNIGEYAFSGRESLTSVSIANSVVDIGEGAFYRCATLGSITIPDSVKTIGYRLFGDCLNLKSVTLPEGITEFPAELFYGCTSLESIDIPDSVSIIRWDVFKNCESLTEVELSEGIIEIGKNAFENCKSLKNIHLPESLEYMDEYVFYGCSSLVSVKIPKAVTSLTRYSFAECTSLESIEIEHIDDFYEIGACCFEGCTALKSIELPKSQEYLCHQFRYCSSLETITFLGKAVRFEYEDEFAGVNATIYYPGDEPSWTEDLLQNYGGTITWEPYCSGKHTSETGVVVTEPTCEDEGSMQCVCALCEEEYFTAIPALGHSYDEGVITTEATCEEEGVLTFTCTVCDSFYTEAIPAIGHTYDEGVVTTETSCTEPGVKTFTCQNCGDTYTEEIPMIEHLYDDGVVSEEPDCTNSGIMTYTCTACGDSYDEVIPELGHDLMDCVDNEDGATHTGVCTACDEIITDAVHNVVEAVCVDCGVICMETPKLLSCYSTKQDSVKSTWSLIDGVDGYELWRSTTPDEADSWGCIKTINDGTKDRYTNQGLTIGTTYYYKVRAFKYDENGTKVYSEFSKVHYMPAAVVIDKVYSNATDRVRLLWNEISGAYGYQIWRKQGDKYTLYALVKTIGDKGNELISNQGKTTAYSNTGLIAGEMYNFKIRAFWMTEDKQKVFGTFSDEYKVTVMPETPELKIANVKSGQADLDWSYVELSQGYQVWMAESEIGEYKIVKSIDDNKTSRYVKKDLESGKTYYFKVRAYSEVNGRKSFGGFSNVVSAEIP